MFGENIWSIARVELSSTTPVLFFNIRFYTKTQNRARDGLGVAKIETVARGVPLQKFFLTYAEMFVLLVLCVSLGRADYQPVADDNRHSGQAFSEE